MAGLSQPLPGSPAGAACRSPRLPRPGCWQSCPGLARDAGNPASQESKPPRQPGCTSRKQHELQQNHHAAARCPPCSPAPAAPARLGQLGGRRADGPQVGLVSAAANSKELHKDQEPKATSTNPTYGGSSSPMSTAGSLGMRWRR